ncbi:hypothetical protein [Bradyrhizobium sp. 604_D8_N2_3]|uniref:hypothetical protein n=1 Tax=Bradyrhizobium sp. 604_D8_N2_3 TaxID=3240370 RepID=UPI003F23B29F
MSIPDKPKQAVPPHEPFEVWWPKYIERVNESVAAAEEYLEIPKGTISSIKTDPDFIATVKTYAVIEPMLNDLISARPPRSIFGAPAVAQPNNDFQGFVAGLTISGRVGKLALAKSLGLLTEDQVRFIEGVSRIRNRYAHNVKNMHRSLVEILTEEQQHNAKIVEIITGLVSTLPSEIEPFLKMLMYHRLADYLSNALHTLKPPPLPAGGLLSGLKDYFETPTKPDNSR